MISRSGLRSHITEIKSGIEKFAMMLSKNYKLRVIFRGMECHTDGKTIVLPELGLLERKNMTDQELKECHDFLLSVMGFVNHESAHILFTDLKYMAQMHKESGSKKTFILNALEDLRIERKLSSIYLGAQQSLSHLNGWSDQKIAEKCETEPPSLFSQLIYGIIVTGNYKDPSDAKIWKYISKEIQDIILKFRKEILSARKAATTEDVRKLTDSLWDAMKLEMDKQPKKPKPQKQQQGDSNGKDQGKKGDSQEQQGSEDGEEGEATEGDDDAGSDRKSDSKVRGKSRKPRYESTERDEEEAPGQPGLDEDEEGDGGGRDTESTKDDEEGSEDEDTAGGGEDDSQGEEDADEEAESDSGESISKTPSSGKDDSEESGEDETTVDSGTESGVDEQEKGETQSSPLFDETEKVEEKEAPRSREDSINQFMKDEIAPRAVTEFEGDYLIYTTENDSRVAVTPPANARQEMAKIEDEVRSVYGPLKRTLEARLRSRSLSYRVGDLEEGEIDRSTLHRLPLGLGENIFQQEVKGNTLKDTCVGLIYDSSGSMDYRLPDLRKTLFVFAEVLNMMRVPFMSWGFTTGESEGRDIWYGVTENDRKLFTRFGAVKIHVVKDFAEQWMMVKDRLPGVGAHINAYDGECLRIGAQEMLNRPERRKFLFVFCDGAPMGNEPGSSVRLGEYLKRTAHELTANKMVELIGVGIGTDAPKNYYPRAFSVYDMAKLPELVMSELGRFLLV